MYIGKKNLVYKKLTIPQLIAKIYLKDIPPYCLLNFQSLQSGNEPQDLKTVIAFLPYIVLMHNSLAQGFNFPDSSPF